MAYSKIIYGGKTLMDLTPDTVEADKLLEGVTAHDKAGESVTGTCKFDVDSSGATATDAEVLKGKTYAKGGEVRTGTMPNNASYVGVITNFDPKYIPIGYHDGGGYFSLDPIEMGKIVPENIRQGVVILGIEGAMSTTEGANAQSKEVTPSTKEQTVVPDTAAGYNYLAQVVVQPIPYVEAENAAGGITVTIG